MDFGNLTYLFLLWLIPALVFFFMYSFMKKQRCIQEFCGPDLSGKLLPQVQRGRQKLKALLVILAVLFLIMALVRPRWGFHWEDIKRTGVDVMVAVDVSKSMLARDIEPSRLERARRKVQDLVKMLEGDRIGLIAFAGTSFVQCPLTLDYGAFSMFLEYLSPDLIPVPGTAIGDAVRKAVESFSRQERTAKALILITDGEDHDSKPLEAAELAKKEGVRIFTIGIGKEDEGAPIPAGDGSGGFMKDRQGNMIMSKLDEKTLQKIALETGGSYVRSVTGDMDLEAIYKNEIRKSMEQKELTSTRKKRWEERFQWFLAAAVLLLLAEFFIREKSAVKHQEQ
ncbi:MAG: VWA domain-containing protein [Deltaproteobacteria bacterium]|nr:VWA domain-containing protein [Deltaproteobacteria bacterium]